MKFCPNCGAQLSDDTKFCFDCGQKIEVAAPAAPVEEVIAPQQPVVEPETYTYQAPVQEAAPQTGAYTYGGAASQSYEAPQQSYEAPQQSYEAPQQSYTAPQQNFNYSSASSQPQPGFSFGANNGSSAPKKGKAGLVIGAIAGVFALLVVLCVIIFGGKSDDPNLGMYNAVSCEVLGVDMGVDNEWIELKKNGKATLALMGDEYSCKWELEGQTFTLTQAGDEFVGTLNNGVLTIDFSGLVYTYQKEGGAPAAIPTEAPAVVQPAADGLEAWEGDWYGWWVIDTVHSGDTSVEGNWWDCAATLEIGNDGTANLVLWDEDTTKRAPLAEANLNVELIDGEMSFESVDGDFNGSPVTAGEWNGYTDDWNEEDDVIWFYGEYEDDEYKFEYMVFMLKWGAKWDNIYEEDPSLMPYYYEWYLGELADGETSAPKDFEEALASGTGGSYMESTTATAAPATTPAAPAVTPAPAANTAGALYNGTTISGCTMQIVGAEHFVDSDGKDAIRVWYDFTNNSNETTYASGELDLEVTQDGYEQVGTYASYDNDVAEEYNDYMYIRPGVTIRCVSEYSMKTTGGKIQFRYYDWWEDTDVVVAEFDPANLPGAPAEALPLVKVANPQWTAGMATAGTMEGVYNVSIKSAEVVPGDDGNVLRVYFDYTNNSAEKKSLWLAVDIYGYQDGMEMEEGYADAAADSDDLFWEDVEPGATVTASYCLQLRSDSPVEVEVSDWDGNYLGAVFPVA